MAHKVAQVPFLREVHFVKQRKLFKERLLHFFRRIGTERVGRRAAKLRANGKEADERKKEHRSGDHRPAEGGRRRRPVGHVEIGAHHAVLAHDELAYEVSEHPAERRPEDADNEAVEGIVEEYRAVFESERFEYADLRLLLCGDAVHRRHHRQDRDGEEEDGEDRSHRLAFGRLSHRFLVYCVVLF